MARIDPRGSIARNDSRAIALFFQESASWRSRRHLNSTWQQICDEHQRQSVCDERHHTHEAVEDTASADFLFHSGCDSAAASGPEELVLHPLRALGDCGPQAVPACLAAAAGGSSTLRLPDLLQ